MVEHLYSRLTVDGDRKTRWLCGCFETVDGYFKFCKEHHEPLQKAINAQIDELDLTIVVDEKS